MRRQKCRIWWPEQLLSCKLDSSLLLFGWFFCSHTAVDIVVATGIPLNQIKLLLRQSLQEILFYSNRKLPTLLQDCSKFSIVGFYAVEYCHESSGMVNNRNGHLDYESFNQRLQSSGVEFSTTTATNYGELHPQKNQDLFKDVTSTKDCRRWQCSCDKLDRFLEQCGQYSIKNDNWIQLCSHPRGFLKEIAQIPKLHHMHCHGDLLTTCDVHVISYKQPTYGIHHFSLSSWSSSEPVETHAKRPEWVEKLHEKQPISELETVFLALNSASAAKTFCESGLASQHSLKRLQIISMLLSMTWCSISILLASFFTIFYIILNICHGFLCYASQSLSCTMLAKVFSHTSKNLHIRSCQFLYSPIFLQGSGSRLQSSVEYAHRAALHRHSIWSAIFIDVVLGNVVGWALLLHREAVYFWILHLVRNITNNLLRSGCVWLMGVPAGFKLNTELAAILGMVSLNAIQFWSTLWFFMSFLFRYFVQSLAISGIILGVTIPLALCIDMLKLATFHLSTLHWLISLLYSQQIQALASLWRLFRGRKWNPLRQRLDSYDYTVEQHVVGSLLFTPLLLLLPTSSVFYIFFSIMKATASVISILIEITISVLHATPYAEIFLWMVRRKRFPSGIWFEIIPVQSSNMPTSKISFSSSGSQGGMTENYSDEPESVALVLHSNFATLGQVILPHYRKAFRGASLASGSAYAYGVLSGQRIPSSLGTGLPSTMPWISISFLQYWQLCYDAIHAV